MDSRRYTIHIELSNGWSTYLVRDFFRAFPEITKRKALVSDAAHADIYDNYSGRKLSDTEALNFLYGYEFQLCQDYKDWESFIQTYKDMPEKAPLRDALKNLKSDLIDSNRLYDYRQYRELFPNGIFIKEISDKIEFISKELKKPKQPSPELDISEAERSDLMNSLKKEKSNILRDYLKIDNDPEIDPAREEDMIIQFLEDRKVEIGQKDIEEILEKLIEELKKQSISQTRFDQLISISADFREFKSQRIFGTLPEQEERKYHRSIIRRLLALLNELIRDLK